MSADDHVGVAAGATDVVFETGVGGAVPLVMTAELPVGLGLTIPTEGVSDLQTAIASANATARHDSLKRIERAFPGYDFQAAAQNVDDRRFTVLQLDGSLMDELAASAVVDPLIIGKEHYWGPHGFSFSHADQAGHLTPPEPVMKPQSVSAQWGLADVGPLAHALRSRWTGIINAAERFNPALGRLCDDFSRVYGCHVNTNIYLSQGYAQGFGRHWDNHDTVILQVAGTKEWAVFPPTALSAEHPWVSQDIPDGELWTGLLEPGMALCIPRGWGHEVRGSDSLSVHYTIGINRPAAFQLLARVEFEAGIWPSMRADVPYDLDAPALSYEGSLFDDAGAYGEALSAIASDDLLERALAMTRARLPLRLHSRLTDTCRALHDHDWDGLQLVMPIPAGAMLHAETPDYADVAFNDRVVRVQGPAFDAFAAAASGRPMSIAELPLVVGPAVDETRRFAEELVLNGLGAIVPR